MMLIMMGEEEERRKGEGINEEGAVLSVEVKSLTMARQGRGGCICLCVYMCVSICVWLSPLIERKEESRKISWCVGE